MKCHLSGEWYSAPDRGSPDGDWYKFSHSFDAEDTDSAADKAMRILNEKYDYKNRTPDKFKNLKLERTEEINFLKVHT